MESICHESSGPLLQMLLRITKEQNEDADEIVYFYIHIYGLH